jgi:hypothetical protein
MQMGRKCQITPASGRKRETHGPLFDTSCAASYDHPAGCDPAFKGLALRLHIREAHVDFIGSIWGDIHAVWRWVVLVAAVLALGKGLIGWLGKQPWTKLDDRLGTLFTITIDIQVLLGILAWLIGPFNFTQLSSAMGNPFLRFVLLEHPIMGLLAAALAHIGRSRSRKAATDAGKHRAAFIFYLLSLLLILLIFILRVSIR